MNTSSTFKIFGLAIILDLTVATMAYAGQYSATLPHVMTPAQAANDPAIETRVNDLLNKLTLQEKIQLLGGGGGMFTESIARLGIPYLECSDGRVGVKGWFPTPSTPAAIARVANASPSLAKHTSPDTLFPAPVVLAASWDRKLAYEQGRAMARDALARHVNIVLSPFVELYREPQDGRNFEFIGGEDPFLASQMAVPYIRGMQAQGVAADVTDFCANEQETGRMGVNSIVSRRALEEIYFPPFKAAVQRSGVWTLMVSYNRLNGEYCVADKFLLTDMLRRHWGFKGLVLSDWGFSHSASTLGCLEAGLNLEMPNGWHYNAGKILPLIKSGKVSVATINALVRPILRMIVAFGLMSHPQKKASVALNDPYSDHIAYELEKRGAVLLKNKHNILPLSAGPHHLIAVVGPNATPAVVEGGGSSVMIPIVKPISMLAAIRKIAPAGTHIAYMKAVPVETPGGKVSNVLFVPGSFNWSYARKFSAHCRYRTHKALRSPSGLVARYYPNSNLQGVPIKTEIDRHINFSWSAKTPRPANHDFSARWTGWITPKKTGVYVFSVSCEDEACVFIDRRKLIDLWGLSRHPTILKRSAVVCLTAGESYPLIIIYGNRAGIGKIHFGWHDMTQLFHAATAKGESSLRKADAVVACEGLDHHPMNQRGFSRHHLDHEGIDHAYALSQFQNILIPNLAAINSRVVVVLNGGSNVAMRDWIHKVPGLLDAWLPGQNGNLAVAGILFGTIDPSGRLPETFEKRWKDAPAYGHFPGHDGATHFSSRRPPLPWTHPLPTVVHFAEGIYMGYRWFDKKHIAPRFPFGFGLSYTTFQLGGLKISSYGIGCNRTITVRVNVTNTGKMAGAEVVQLYIHPLVDRKNRCVQTLKGFSRVNLRPGQSNTALMHLDWHDFAYYNTKAKTWEVPPGRYEISVGYSSRDEPLSQTVRW